MIAVRIFGSAALAAVIAIVALAGPATGQAPAGRVTFAFDDAPVGEPPPGFVFAASRQTASGGWHVRGSGTRRHLVHAGDPTMAKGGFSIAVASMAAPADVRATARLRLVDGDRAAGLVWRYRDPNNFYFFAVNAADNHIGMLRVAGGHRILLDVIRNVDLDSDMWHTLRVIHEGDQIRGIINGLTILRARDNTLTEGGHAGIFSAGNSTIWFDDIVIDSPRD